ncbi:MAG: hypothetical protein ABR592_07785 [Nitriliruptorales bacterium]
MRYEVPSIEDLGSIADHTFMPGPPTALAFWRGILELLGFAGLPWEGRGHAAHGSVPS